jgi:hypothetical protein
MAKSCCESDGSGVVDPEDRSSRNRTAARHDIPSLAPINNYMLCSVSKTLFDHEVLR